MGIFSLIEKAVGAIPVVVDLLDKYGGESDSSSNTTNKNVNIYLTIERFENNREQDVEELMSEMEYIARKELLGNGGNA